MASPQRGPGGILPPRASGQIVFELRPTTEGGRANFRYVSVCVLQITSIKVFQINHRQQTKGSVGLTKTDFVFQSVPFTIRR